MESIIMMIAIIAIFYFLMIRPENKRKKAVEQMRNNLKKGDKLTTIGGIIGTIVHIDGDTLVIETSEDRVRMEITKWAVSNTGVQTSADATPDKPAKEEKNAALEEADSEEPQTENTAKADSDDKN